MIYIIMDQDNGCEYYTNELSSDILDYRDDFDFFIIRIGDETNGIPEFLDDIDPIDGNQTWIAIDQWPGKEF